MKKLNIFIIFVVLTFIGLSSKAKYVEIVVKIQDEIITNLDIENEKKYLIFLNPKLKQLNISRLNNIAKDSLVTEIIKKRELEKFFDLRKKNNLPDSVILKFIKSKNITSKSEFIKILNNKDLNYDSIKNKIYIETLWNQLIYDKYFKNVKIDKVKLKQNILNQFNNENKKYEYNLSEIFFSDIANKNLNETVLTIINSIEEIGFENSANIFSISNTSKNGGMIGWVNELQISEKLNNQINKLNTNQISKPIKMRNGYLLIKLNDKREIKQEIDIDKEFNESIIKETNRQLNAFSIIFFKRLKKNIQINEL